MESNDISFYVYIALAVFVGLFFIGSLIGSIRITPPRHFRAKLRQGRFIKIVQAGPCLKLPYFETLTAVTSLASQQHVIKVNTTTQDKVAVTLELTVAIRVKPGKEREALFNLADPLKQIESHVGKVALAKAPKMPLETLYGDTTSIVQAVSEDLSVFLEDNGYEILSVNLNNITLPPSVQAARDAVYEQTQKKLAAEAQGAALSIQIIAKATAAKKEKKFQGEGAGLQRIAIARAYATSITSLSKALGMDKASGKDKSILRFEILSMLNKQLDMDTLLKIGIAATKVLMVPAQRSVAGDVAAAQMLALNDTK